jgi:Pathogenicity locus
MTFRHASHRSSAVATPDRVETLQDIPNIGPSIAADLRRIGVNRPGELAGRNPFTLYQSLCKVTRTRQDPCVLDVFMSAVRFMEGAPARPWWHYTAERKRRIHTGEWR